MNKRQRKKMLKKIGFSLRGSNDQIEWTEIPASIPKHARYKILFPREPYRHYSMLMNGALSRKQICCDSEILNDYDSG